MTRYRLRLAALVFGTALAPGACIPYTVGTTAHTTPAGDAQSFRTAYAIPNGLRAPDDSVSVAVVGFDYELRRGLDDRSDIGVRFPSFSGAVINYKRRITDDATFSAPATAFMVGGGVVNWLEHAHLEATVIRSGARHGEFTFYGGARVMQTIPLSRFAVSDTPTAGGFFGVMFGDDNSGFTPEIGIYYDRSALGLRSSTIIVVPSITLRGGGFGRVFRLLQLAPPGR